MERMVQSTGCVPRPSQAAQQQETPVDRELKQLSLLNNHHNTIKQSTILFQKQRSLLMV